MAGIGISWDAGALQVWYDIKFPLDLLFITNISKYKMRRAVVILRLAALSITIVRRRLTNSTSIKMFAFNEGNWHRLIFGSAHKRQALWAGAHALSIRTNPRKRFEDKNCCDVGSYYRVQ